MIWPLRESSGSRPALFCSDAYSDKTIKIWAAWWERRSSNTWIRRDFNIKRVFMWKLIWSLRWNVWDINMTLSGCSWTSARKPSCRFLPSVSFLVTDACGTDLMAASWVFLSAFHLNEHLRIHSSDRGESGSSLINPESFLSSSSSARHPDDRLCRHLLSLWFI